MQTFQHLLDQLAARAGSDRKAAPLVGVRQSSFSKWRRAIAYPDDAQALTIADVLQLPAAYVLAIVRAERTDSRKARVEWLRIAERFAAGILLGAPLAYAVAPQIACVLCKKARCTCRRPGINALGRFSSLQAAP